MNRSFDFSLGEFYHIYNRGVEGRDLFLSDYDRARFVKLLYLSNSTEPYKFDRIKGKALHEIKRGDALVAIGAYVLMPNHFHLLIREVSDGGISKFMEKLATGYSAYFNKLNNRKGVLFQNRFRAEHVDNDEYLKYLYAYIHLNPRHFRLSYG
jgi:putative transposase